MVFRKLKRTWSHNSLNYIPRFKEMFPELRHISNEDLADRFIDLNMDFYYEKTTPVPFLIRLTIPFAIALIILMLIALPITFIFTGEWGYSLGKNNRILNWFRSLKLNA